MGFSVYYRTAEPVEADKRSAVIKMAERFTAGHSWYGCEPLFLQDLPDGGLWGASKPRLIGFSDEDFEAAESENLPDGTISDLIECLCRISYEFGIDWEIGADNVPDPVGFIRSGDADAEVSSLVEFLVEAGELTFEEERFQSRPPRKFPPSDRLTADDDEEDFPPTIRLWPEPE